jgi:hypothetical protein
MFALANRYQIRRQLLRQGQVYALRKLRAASSLGEDHRRTNHHSFFVP